MEEWSSGTDRPALCGTPRRSRIFRLAQLRACCPRQTQAPGDSRSLSVKTALRHSTWSLQSNERGAICKAIQTVPYPGARLAHPIRSKMVGYPALAGRDEALTL